MFNRKAQAQAILEGIAVLPIIVAAAIVGIMLILCVSAVGLAKEKLAVVCDQSALFTLTVAGDQSQTSTFATGIGKNVGLTITNVTVKSTTLGGFPAYQVSMSASTPLPFNMNTSNIAQLDSLHSAGPDAAYAQGVAPVEGREAPTAAPINSSTSEASSAPSAGVGAPTSTPSSSGSSSISNNQSTYGNGTASNFLSGNGFGAPTSTTGGLWSTAGASSISSLSTSSFNNAPASLSNAPVLVQGSGSVSGSNLPTSIQVGGASFSYNSSTGSYQLQSGTSGASPPSQILVGGSPYHLQNGQYVSGFANGLSPAPGGNGKNNGKGKGLTGTSSGTGVSKTTTTGSIPAFASLTDTATVIQPLSQFNNYNVVLEVPTPGAGIVFYPGFSGVPLPNTTSVTPGGKNTSFVEELNVSGGGAPALGSFDTNGMPPYLYVGPTQ